MNNSLETLAPEDEDVLRALVPFIIPASETYRLPAADEPLIFADIIATALKRSAETEAMLSASKACIADHSDGAFADCDAEMKDTIVADFRARYPTEAMFIANLTLQCYYRDDRVMRTLDMEARAPFPKGHEVPQGDWSLLDPVRARDPFYIRTD